jgi:hypothetical protein
MNIDKQPVAARLRAEGFCFAPAALADDLLGGKPALTDWPDFVASWNDMPLDTYMADGGRYRRRRYATLSVAAGAERAKLAPPAPHYQGREYNALNGGIARTYEPIPQPVVEGATLRALLALCCRVFNALAATSVPWHVEVHQFRIEARQGDPGQPTPEGVHRDGVDFVMVMMVRRDNIAEGTTTVHRPDGSLLTSFTLTEPLDMTFLDDHRCLHGVTPVVPLDPAKPACRDVLVVTFRRLVPA